MYMGLFYDQLLKYISMWYYCMQEDFAIIVCREYLLYHDITKYLYLLHVLCFSLSSFSKFYSGSSNSVPENIPQVPLRIHAVPKSTSSVITSSCLGFTVSRRHANCNPSLW